jgi:TatD DNase family protein
MELIDTHCHLTFEQLADDVDSVIERSKAAGVTAWITVGTDNAENQKALELAGKFDGLYVAVGIHPHEAKNCTSDDIKQLRQFAQNEKVVAIGETGLDFHYDFSSPAEQIRLFAAHLQIAAESNLPVIIHSRKSFEDTLDILDRYGKGVRKVVFHCFGYLAQQAKIILEKGYYLSFTGQVTFKNAQKTREAAEIVPAEELMIETDCPYMSPEPMRKQKINEPALLIHTAKFLAELKKIGFEDFAQTVTSTSRAFFDLPQIK